MSITATPADKPVEMPGIQALFNRTFITAPKPEDKVEPVTPDPDATAPTEPKPEVKPEKPAKLAKPTPAAAPAPQPSMTASEVADLAAQTAAKVIEGSKPKPEDKPAPDASLSEEEKEDLAVVEQMAAMFPDKYKHAANQYRESLAKLAAYKADWEKENPDEEFDQDAKEHETWMDKNVFGYEEKDFRKAELQLLTDQAVAKAKKQIQDEQKTEAQKTEEKTAAFRQAMPKIETQKFLAAKKFLADLGDEYAGLLTDTGAIDKDKLKALQESDPDAVSVLTNYWRNLDAEVFELKAVWDGHKAFDAKNPVHTAVRQFIADTQQQMIAQPREQQLDKQGRPFVSLDAYDKMSPDQKVKHWTFSAADIAKLRASHLAALASKNLTAQEELVRRKAKALGVALPPKSAKPAQRTSAAPTETNGGAVTKPQTPMAGGGTRMAPKLPDASGKGGNALSLLYQRTL